MGTEEQSGFSGNSDDLENGLSLTKNFCKKKNLPYPAFVVIQTGTKVMQKRNIGSFESEMRIQNEIPIEIQLIKSLELCKKYGIFMKDHNADFLDENSLSWHPRLGIHAANVAPEFAIAETKALLDTLNFYKLDKIKKEFINISVRSNKWKKWILKGSNLNDLDKTLICGHYNFSKKNFKILKEDLNNFLKKKKINLNLHLKTKIEINIIKYLKNFRVINNV